MTAPRGVEPVPAWAGRLSAGAPAALVARCVQVAVLPGVDPDRLRTVVARRLAAGADPDAAVVLDDLEREAVGRLRLPMAASAAEALLALGARVHVVGHPPYPARLRWAWPDLGAPLWLFVRSPDGALPAGPAVAVVGTRHPTLDGLGTARQLGRVLAERGVTVVSGMARGIDQAAHQGALDMGGPTVAVLGAGLDVDYPSRDGPLRDAVAEAGGLVTEYLPGMGPRARNFLWRNRIIAGLADATVVVEGRARSGALQTARLAGAQGRDVLAVPGSINQPTSRGPLDLIRDGAVPVTRLDDVLAAVGLGGAGPAGAPQPAAAPEQAHVAAVPEPAATVLDLLSATPAPPGAIAAAAGLPAAATMAAIGELVARGLARRTPHGFARGGQR